MLDVLRVGYSLEQLRLELHVRVAFFALPIEHCDTHWLVVSRTDASL